MAINNQNSSHGNGYAPWGEVDEADALFEGAMSNINDEQLGDFLTELFVLADAINHNDHL